MASGPSMACPACNEPVSISDDCIVRHFEGKPVLCGKCATQLDWWTTAWRELESGFLHGKALALAGARQTRFALTLHKEGRTIYKFSEQGIPAGSKVLHVDYTPQLHRDAPAQKYLSDEVALEPLPAGEPGAAGTEVTVFATWVPGSSADESWESLVDAFESYSHQRYPSMIVPATSVVESALSGLLSRQLPSLVSKRRADDFPDAAASYSHRLNVLLPMISHYNGIPQLPPGVHGALGKLRALRNDLQQGGIASSTLDARAAAELLCGALFGFRYLRYVEERLPPSASL
jgi:hypothetical protein